MGEALADVLRDLGWDARRGDAELLAAWAPLVGPAIAKASKPLGLREGVLEVGVVGAAWAGELKLLGPNILQKFAQRFGPGRVTALRTKVVGRAGLASKGDDVEPAPGLPVGPPWATGQATGAAQPEERARWAQPSLKIADPKLAGIVARAGAALADLQAARSATGALPCPQCGAPCGPAKDGLASLCPPCAWVLKQGSVRPDTAPPSEAT